MMWIQLALGRSRITFKQPSFKLESVNIHSNHGTKVPSLQYATVRNVNSLDKVLLTLGGNQNIAPGPPLLSAGSPLPQGASSLSTLKANPLNSPSDLQRVLH